LTSANVPGRAKLVIRGSGDAFSFWYSESLTRNEALGGIPASEDERRRERVTVVNYALYQNCLPV